ncbi:MAG TPA: NDP-sugar synthase [Actinomycetota bacterium]|nr:NDP-sugar synthase [Actinomycetota bacterium]
MNAVVLVGGEGTRLRPLTETIPKPLVPFMNRPFLDHVLDHLAEHGVDEVVCSSPYLETVFHAFLETREGRLPSVRWITETEPLGTAGAIAGALDLLDGTFLALNGDILTDMDLGALVELHRARNAVATIALHRVEDARPFGLVEAERDGRVLAFREKPGEPVPGAINAGVYVLEPAALAGVPPGRMVSIERETYPELIGGGAPVYSAVASGYWLDLGTPEAYLRAHADALDGRIAEYRGLSRPLLAPGARMEPGAAVGPYVVMAPGAVVAAGADVDTSVLHEGATVAGRARVRSSILGPGAAVGAGAVVRDAVLAERARVGDGARLAGARVAPGEVVGAAAG